MSDTLRGAIYGLSGTAIWGGLYVVSDVVLETIPPFMLLSLRLLLGLFIFWPIIYQKYGTPWPEAPSRLALMGVGFVGFGISLGAQFVGTDFSTAVNGSLITSAAPAFILLFAPPILGEKLTGRRMISVALATLGVVIIINPANADFSSETFAGDVILGIAALTWGLYSVLVRWGSMGVDTLTLTFYAFFGGLALTLPATAQELRQNPIGDLTLEVILGVLYVGVISTAIAQWLWNRAFALVEASTASLFFFAQPVVGASLGVLLLGQAFTLNLVIGAALIVIGVLLSIYRRAPRRRRATV